MDGSQAGGASEGTQLLFLKTMTILNFRPPPQPGPNSGYESKLVANSRGRMTYELSTAALRKDESCSKEEI